MTELETAKSARTAAKGWVTRSIKALDALIKARPLDVESLRVELETLDKRVISLDATQARIEAALVDDDAIINEQNEQEPFYNTIRNVKANVRRALAKAEVKVAPVAQTAAPLKKQMTLPKLPIPYYDGDPLTYQSFLDSYNVAVGSTTLENIEKMTYLKNHLVGTAAEALQDWVSSNGAYEECLAYFKQRFGDPETRRDALGAKLIDMEEVKSESDVGQLRKLLDVSQACVRCLDSLGVNQDSYGFLVRLLIIRKLPEGIYKEFQRTYRKAEERNLASLLAFLTDEVCIWERAHHASGNGNSNSTISRSSDQKKEKRVDPAKRQTMAAVKVEESKKMFNKRSNPKSSSSCVFCCGDADHFSNHCGKQIDVKMELAKERKICTNCLKIGHSNFNCFSKKRCSKCSRKHDASMHKAEWGVDQEECQDSSEHDKNRKPDKKRTQLGVGAVSCDSDVLRLVVTLVVIGPNGTIKVRALLDDGSTNTFATRYLQGAVGAKSEETKSFELITFASESRHVKSDIVNFKIITSSGEQVCLPSLLCNDTAIEQSKVPLEANWVKEALSRGLKPSDAFQGDSEVDDEIHMVIGSDFYDKFVTGKRVLLPSGVACIETEFGWAFRGPTGSSSSKSSCCLIQAVVHESFGVEETEDENLLNLMKRFAAVDDLPAEESIDDENTRYMEEFWSTVEKVDGKYQVPLLWKGIERPCSNEASATAQFRNSKNRLISKGRWNDYANVLKEYEDFGAIETDPGQPGEGYFIPHHAVFRPDSDTHKIRIVFNASSKSSNGYSLNDCLDTGPNLLPHIVLVLLDFRADAIGVVGDIKKAFLTVMIKEEDRKYIRIVWDEPKRLCRLPFGCVSSPFSLIAVIFLHLKKLYEESQIEYDTYDRLKRALYMDNISSSLPSEQQVQLFQKETINAFNEAGMTIHKWETSAKQMESPTKDPVKVMGLQWNSVDDSLALNEIKVKECKNKRQFLGQLAVIFDPLGFLAPIILTGKYILQKMWKLKLRWDENFNEEISLEVACWQNNLKQATNITFPRELGLVRPDLQLHCFVDASEKGYGAVFYIVAEGQSSDFVCAKTRVAPLKSISIPRLELMAAVLGAETVQLLKQSTFLANVVTNFWTDSKIALAWILSDSHRWSVFIANRVAKIQRFTDIQQWRHVPGIDNPADLASRSENPADVIDKPMWRHGPEWLIKKEMWPAVPNDISEPEIERKKSIQVNAVALQEKKPDLFPRISSYPKLIGVCGRVLRLRTLKTERNMSWNLSWQERVDAERSIIKIIQKESFEEDLSQISKENLSRNSRLWNLNPFIDEYGIIRVGGRLSKSDLEWELKHPVILPYEHRYVRLLIEDVHKRLLHGGVEAMMTELRKKFWILKGRRLCRSVRSRCSTCIRFDTKVPVVNSIFAPLPRDRTSVSCAFSSTGLDFCGPFYVRDPTEKSLEGIKVYILLFVCSSTRAVHLEVTDSMNTNDFMLAFSRFTARRSMPKLIRSDNAKTFHQASRMVKVNWLFNPPLAPWWGGAYERIVRSIKAPLKKVIKTSFLSKKEFEVIVLKVEKVLNSRPLTSVSGDSEDSPPITPAILMGQVFSEEEFSSKECLNKEEIRRRYRYIIRVVELFRKRFMQEYVPTLARQAVKSFYNKPNTLKEGSLAFMEIGNKKRKNWPLVRIKSLVKGNDGRCRLAEIQCADGTIFWRAIQKLIPLEADVTDDEFLSESSDPTDDVVGVTNPSNVIEENDGKKIKIGSNQKKTKKKIQVSKSVQNQSQDDNAVVITRVGRKVKPKKFFDDEY